MNYKIVPEIDYYNGIPTILNSEEAALVMCNKIYNGLDEFEQFFDKDFGPKDNKDIEGSSMSMYFSGNPPPGYPIPEECEWMRPEEFCAEDPEFIHEGASANDVKQGRIGNCWFIGALSVLATRDQLLRGGIGNLDVKENFKANP